MTGKEVWLMWQSIVLACAQGFTPVGQARFVQWSTGLVLNLEEHTITQSLVGLDACADWKALESFAEAGSWNPQHIQRATAQAAAADPEQRFFGYQVWAGDDTFVLRGGSHVWGICSFRNYSARCPNRASTILAHNWVFCGALLRQVHQPPLFLPVAGRLYFRQSQLPEPEKGPPIVFQSKCQLMVALARDNAISLPGLHLLSVDGGYCKRSVVRELACPQVDEHGNKPVQVEVVTRIRCDACLHLPLEERKATDKKKPGQPRKWGQKLPKPSEAEQWPGEWQQGRAFVYGQYREISWKECVCYWRATGADMPVKVVLAKVQGFSNLFTLLSTAVELNGLQVVEIFSARGRQEDGIRDLKQKLGWEECKAWTRLPIERTTQTQLVTLTCLRLLQLQLQQKYGDSWWVQPLWNKGKTCASIQDVLRLLWNFRSEFQALLSDWLQTVKNSPSTKTIASL